MKFGIAVKSLLARALEQTGRVEKIFHDRSGSLYLILTYHRIIPPCEAPAGLQPGMYVEPDTFEMHLEYLTRYFHVIPFRELDGCIASLPRNGDSKPFCILTFDDGWFDFHRYAYPILSRRKLPATVFLPTDYIGTDRIFWTDIVAYLAVTIGKGRSGKPTGVLKSDLAKYIVGQKGSDESKVENVISALKQHDQERISAVVREISECCQVAFPATGRAFLNWDEAREMYRSGLITFGSHTDGHRILIHLRDDEILEELNRSRRKLIEEHVVNADFLPFCYPNGDYDGRVARLVSETGYHASVTTKNGWNDANDPVHELKRISIHQDISSSRPLFGCRLANLL